ncbi:MAG: porin family protein [Salinibacter sp.]
MRRLLGSCLLLSVLLGAPPASAQLSPQFGVALGVNIATLSAPADVGTRQMASGGVVVRLGLPGPLSLEPQLLLSQKGTTVQGGGGSIRYGAGYLNLPLLLRVDGPSLGAVSPYGMLGGFGGVKLFEQQRAGGDLGFPLNVGASFFRRTDAGLTAGVGGTIPLAVRYEHGLVDVARSVDEQPYAQAPFPSSAQTRTWAIMLRLGI